ncbi:MAG: Crp/Fnr family transcriptional regulator [Hyphomicrobium sp.]|nr:Crp/Fnr family transcriptional regulator [Hyphomicrobium sp.]
MATKDSLVDIIGKTALFGGLDVPDRQSVVSEMREASFGAGEMVFGRGDPGRDIYLVVSGRVRLSVLTPEGRELSFAHAESGQIFGEIAVLDGGSRTADATAVSKVEARSLSKGSLNRLIETRSAVRESVIRFLCNRVREADQQLEGIALYPIEVRLARFFLAAARQKGDADAERVALDLPISQSELALLIGASRPKVNAALALLEEQGAIERSTRGFVCRIEALEDIAGAG